MNAPQGSRRMFAGLATGAGKTPASLRLRGIMGVNHSGFTRCNAVQLRVSIDRGDNPASSHELHFPHVLFSKLPLSSANLNNDI